MKFSWKRVLSFALCVVMCLPACPVMETNAAEGQQNNIEVVYSSYNDLEPEYALDDMTESKGLSFQAQTQESADGSVGIVVNPSITYQTWEGFGGSMDGATVYKILGLSKEDQEKVMNDLFNPESGNAYNLMRLSIGCSDFTIDSPGTNGVAYYADKNAGSGYWTYADAVDEDTNGDGSNDSDMDLSGFSIQKDIDNGQISLLKKAMEINPDVEFFASMWSAPAWMKKNQDMSWFEGQVDPELRDDCYEVLAEYYCKYIKAYKEEGIMIKAVTLQNEPDIKIGYPCMMFTPENQIKFAKCLSAAFAAHGLDVEIWGLDANEFRTWEYAVPLLESEIGDEIDGIGYHNYGGLPMSYPNSLHESYPDKSFHITEMTIGGAKLVEYMRNWINSYAYWITYYDIDMQNRTYGPGPSFWSTPQSTDADHWSLSQVSDDGNGSYQLTAKYNTFGQFSRYIDKGAVRIASSEANGNVSNVAFQNPDGSIAVVVVNRNTSVSGTNVVANTPEQKICISTPDGEFYDTLPGDTIATYTWMPSTGDWINEQDWSIEASHEDSRYLCYQAIDNSFDSFYFSGTEQGAGQYIELNMGNVETFDQITLFSGDDYANDYPGTFNVFASNDGQIWSEVAVNQIGSRRISNIKLEEVCEARYIKIELTESRNAWWNISDIAVFYSGAEPKPHAETEYVCLNTKEQWTVEASSNRVTESYASAIVDGDAGSEWVYQQAQEAGYYIIVDFGTEKTFDKAAVDFGTTADYARGFQLYTSLDRNEWIPYGDIQSVDGTTKDENDHVVSEVSSGTECTARYLKLELTESVSDHWLRINEINVGTNTQTEDTASKATWSAMTCEHGINIEGYGVDNSLNTVWTSGITQTAGETRYLINLGEAQEVCGIAINNGSEMWSYLEDCEVYAWDEGEDAKLVAKAEGHMSNTRLYFEPQQAKYLWIKAGTTSTANRQFAIADINVYTERVRTDVTSKYVITASAGENGSISPSGTVVVKEGESQKYTITANSGYYVKDVKVDGVSVGAVTEYTFNDIGADHIIEAAFEEEANSNDWGDANGDKKIDSKDVALILRYVVGLEKEMDENIVDVNVDGVVNSTDAALVLRYVSGEITEFPGTSLE